jgi:hypothetical protein
LRDAGLGAGFAAGVLRSGPTMPGMRVAVRTAAREVAGARSSVRRFADESAAGVAARRGRPETGGEPVGAMVGATAEAGVWGPKSGATADRGKNAEVEAEPSAGNADFARRGSGGSIAGWFGHGLEALQGADGRAMPALTKNGEVEGRVTNRITIPPGGAAPELPGWGRRERTTESIHPLLCVDCEGLPLGASLALRLIR